MKSKQPFGLWPSVISPEKVASANPKLACLQSHGERLFWVESRPKDSSRNVIVSLSEDGLIEDILPPPYSHYSRVHEYGGMAYAIADNHLYFVNAEDQCIYQLEIGSNKQPVAITDIGSRFADLIMDSANNRLIAVCEQHGDQGEPENYLAGISLDKNNHSLNRLVSGADFYAYPRISPDGKTLASGGNDGRLMIWDVKSGQCLHSLPGFGMILSIAYHPAGDVVACRDWLGRVRCCDSDSGELLRELVPNDHLGDQGVTLAFSPDGASMAMAGFGSGVQIWNSELAELQMDLAVPGRPAGV